MFKSGNPITNVKSRHSFACFDLQFVDPTAYAGVKGDQVPYSALHMVQRGSGVRWSLFYRIENVTFDHAQHDDGVIKNVLQHFFKDLFADTLADFMPVTSPHSGAVCDADENALSSLYWQLATGIWNGVTCQKYVDVVSYVAGGANPSRLTVNFGNGLAFLMTSNPHEIHRGPNKLRGTVAFCGKKHHFVFFHGDLANDDVEGLISPTIATTLLLEALDKHAPVFRGIEQELKFAD